MQVPVVDTACQALHLKGQAAVTAGCSALEPTGPVCTPGTSFETPQPQRLLMLSAIPVAMSGDHSYQPLTVVLIRGLLGVERLPLPIATSRLSNLGVV
jgi:hypothetical protein